MNLVTNTAFFSLAVQLIAGFFLIKSYFHKLKPEDHILKIIVLLEIVVQVIEAIFYLFIIKMFKNGIFNASFRYYDWFFSTPAMLISTMFFLEYLHKKPVEADEVLNDNKLVIAGLIGFNALMLIFGFMGEKGYIGKYQAFFWGTLFFVASFGCLYTFAKKSRNGKIFISIMFSIWFLYGFAFLMPIKAKNISYNFLDIFSKNFYGIFLYFVIRNK